MCEHDIDTKVVNGVIITYCKKCGEILDQKPISFKVTYDESNQSLPDNGGQILYG